ncbi:MAG: hypothetical protein IJ524_05075 [Bacteroidales bacterium]|nr:hypothetical protein [Bacteroidales bacterium]
MNNKKIEERQSFFIRITGDFYDFASDFAVPIVVCGTPIFLVLFGLTFVCHWDIVCSLFSLVSGFSLLFIAYIISLILVIDRLLLYKVCKGRAPRYSLTVVWGIVLIGLGITLCFVTNNYKKQYKFDCAEWYVDEEKRLYHWNEKCENIGSTTYIAKGYEIRGRGLTFCDYCKDELDDYGSSYEPNRRP